MALTIHHIAILEVSIPTVVVIDKAVTVIVYSIAGNFTMIGVYVGLQVGVLNIHAGVNNGNQGPLSVGKTGGLLPGFFGTDVRTNFTAVLTSIVEIPLLTVLRIVGSLLLEFFSSHGFALGNRLFQVVNSIGNGILDRGIVLHLL